MTELLLRMCNLRIFGTVANKRVSLRVFVHITIPNNSGNSRKMTQRSRNTRAQFIVYSSTIFSVS